MNNKLNKLLLASGLLVGSTVAIIPNREVFSIPVQIKQAQATTANVVEDNNFRFKLNSCSRRGKAVSCSLLITNLDKDRELRLWSGSNNSPRIMDREGNEYLPKKVDLGSKTTGNATNYVGTKLMQGIPIKAAFHYDVPQNISKLAILEVNYVLSGSTPNKAEFRDVSIVMSANTSTPQRKK